MLNASRTAANNFDDKEHPTINISSAPEYTMFASEQLLTTGASSGLATRVTLTRVLQGWWESLLHGSGPASDSIFEPQYMIIVGLRFKCTPVYRIAHCIVYESKTRIFTLRLQ
jgi:hypothetical protein